MRNLRDLVVLVLSVVFAGAFAATASAAGGLMDGNNFGGNFSFGGKKPYYNSYLDSNGDASGGSFRLGLDPTKVSFDSGNWSFFTNYWDTSYWTASCYLSGKRNSSEDWPQSQNWSQSSDRDDLRINASLSMYSNEYEWDGVRRQVLNINGNFNIDPVEFTSSSFHYWEGEEDYYSWPDGYGESPTITKIPVWHAQYSMNGRFLAATPELAQAMGAPYAQAVPEPSTLGLLGTGLLAIAGWLWHKKKR